MRILLINCEDFDYCARTICEVYEGDTISTKELTKYLTINYTGINFIIYPNMSDFMDAFNNEEIPYTSHFMSYLD